MMSKQRELDLIDIGKKLANAQSKEALMNLLPQAASMLEDVEQSPPPSTIFAMKGCSDALVDPTLLGHKDKDVGVLVALCISEIMRIVAPDAPYSDDCLKEIFQLIVGIFRGLDDVHSPSFSSRVNILETVAKVRSCVVMLDLDCDDLITEMFEIFFTTISDKHPEPVFVAMRNVLSLVINEGEEVSSQILEVILNNLLRQKEEVAADVTKEGGGLEEQDADETNKVATEGTEGSGLEKQDADETNKVVTEGTEGSRLEKQDADETSEVTTEGTEGSGLEKQDADDTNKVATEGTEGRRLEKQDADETNEVTTEGTEGSRLEKQDADETNEVTTEGTEGSRKPKHRHPKSVGKQDVKKVITPEVEKDQTRDPGIDGDNIEKVGVEMPQRLSTGEEGEKDQEKHHIPTKRKRGPSKGSRKTHDWGTPRNVMDGKTELEKEITEKDAEDQEENQPAKRKHLPEDSSRNDPEEAGSLEESSKNHAVEVSSKDKDEEEVAVGVDHQDVEQMPTQTDKEGEEKDVVENLSAKRKAGRPKGSAAKNKRKLSGHPKSSGKKAITRKAGGDGKGREKEEQMEEEEGQTAKSKPGRPKSTGKKEIRSTAGIDVKTGQKHEEKNNINTPKTKTKPGRTKGSINKAVREVSSGDEKASSTDKGKEDLVGCGIKVWWPLDRRFYKGEVISYDAKKKRHKVLYDDGEQEILDLGVERWQLTTKKQRLMKNPQDTSTPAWAPVPLRELNKAKALAQQEDVPRPSNQLKQQSSSKSGKKRVSQEGKSNNLEARFLKEKETPVKNTISEFDFDEDNDDDGEAPKGGKMKGKQVQSSSTSKGSSGKVFKHSVGDSSTEKPTTSRDSEGDAAAALSPDMSPGDGEPLNTWVIRRQKAH
ncbi:unnamed protein product [Sphagnum tenellum]